MHHSTCPVTPEAGLCFSTLANDPEMGQLVDLFVQELPSRLVAIQQATDDGNLPEAGRLAHQLKGAGGSYGFPHLMEAAALVERVARGQSSKPEFESALGELAIACAQTRAGSPADLADHS